MLLQRTVSLRTWWYHFITKGAKSIALHLASGEIEGRWRRLGPLQWINNYYHFGDCAEIFCESITSLLTHDGITLYHMAKYHFVHGITLSVYDQVSLCVCFNKRHWRERWKYHFKDHSEVSLWRLYVKVSLRLGGEDWKTWRYWRLCIQWWYHFVLSEKLLKRGAIMFACVWTLELLDISIGVFCCLGYGGVRIAARNLWWSQITRTRA